VRLVAFLIRPLLAYVVVRILHKPIQGPIDGKSRLLFVYKETNGGRDGRRTCSPAKPSADDDSTPAGSPSFLAGLKAFYEAARLYIALLGLIAAFPVAARVLDDRLNIHDLRISSAICLVPALLILGWLVQKLHEQQTGAARSRSASTARSRTQNISASHPTTRPRTFAARTTSMKSSTHGSSEILRRCSISAARRVPGKAQSFLAGCSPNLRVNRFRRAS